MCCSISSDCTSRSDISVLTSTERTSTLAWVAESTTFAIAVSSNTSGAADQQLLLTSLQFLASDQVVRKGLGWRRLVEEWRVAWLEEEEEEGRWGRAVEEEEDEEEKKAAVGNGGMELTTSLSGQTAEGKVLVAQALDVGTDAATPQVREEATGKEYDDIENPPAKADAEEDERSAEGDAVDFTKVDDVDWDKAEVPTLALPMGAPAPSAGVLALPMETLTPPAHNHAPVTGARGFRGLGTPCTFNEFQLVSGGPTLSNSALEEYTAAG